METQHQSHIVKNKTFRVFAVLLVVLLAGVLIQHFHKPAEIAVYEYTPLDLSFDKAKVSKIVLQKSSVQVELNKNENSRWVIPALSDVRADEIKINDLLDMVQEAKGEMRGKGQKIYPDFGITDADAFQVAFADAAGKEALRFFVGNKKAGYESAFVRKAGSDAIYLVDADLLPAIGILGDPASGMVAPNYWASMQWAHFESAQVTELKIVQDVEGAHGVTAHVKRENGEWKFVRTDLPFAISAEKVDQFLEGMKTWRGQNVMLPEGKDFGFSKPLVTLDLTMENGKTIQILASTSDPEKNAYNLQVTGEPVVFQLSKYYMENLAPDDSRFFTSNPLGLDESKNQTLILQSGKQKWEIPLKDNKNEELKKYLEQPKNLYVERLLFDVKEQKKADAVQHQIEVQTEGEAPMTITVGAMLSEQTKLYAAKKQDKAKPLPFALSEGTVNQLFQNPDRLK